MKFFNTEGRCRPRLQYMIDLTERLALIRKRYVERGSYFVINRGRQYGKTTTLRLLEEYLNSDYIVLHMDFQRIGTEEFQDAPAFVNAMIQMFLAAFKTAGIDCQVELLRSLTEFKEDLRKHNLRELFLRLSRICADASRPVVLMIDEVDSASSSLICKRNSSGK